jgi:hypothetical protein
MSRVIVPRSLSRRPAAATLAALLAVSCSSGPNDGSVDAPHEDEQTAPQSAPGEPDDVDELDEPDDPFAVPEEVDEAYVEAVLDEIYAQHSDLLLEVLMQDVDDLDAPTDEQADRLDSLFDGPEGQRRRTELLDLIQTEEARQPLLPVEEFGRAGFRIESVERAADGCIVAIGHLDLTETAVQPLPDEELAAVVLRHEADRESSNETGWQVHDLARLRQAGDLTPLPLDELRGADLSVVVDVTCGER